MQILSDECGSRYIQFSQNKVYIFPAYFVMGYIEKCFVHAKCTHYIHTHTSARSHPWPHNRNLEKRSCANYSQVSWALQWSDGCAQNIHSNCGEKKILITRRTIPPARLLLSRFLPFSFQSSHRRNHFYFVRAIGGDYKFAVVLPWPLVCRCCRCQRCSPHSLITCSPLFFFFANALKSICF